MEEWSKDRAWHWGVALGWSLIYAASTWYYTGGYWSLPLDDPFIYFQYARQAAAGHFLQYNAGETPTTGATSLLYMLMLVPAFWLGAKGMAIAAYALALGAVFFALCIREMRRLGRALGGDFAGEVAGALLALCGPLLWGFFSGMEIGLFSFAILWTFRLALEERSEHLPAAASLLALARPEGILLCALLLAWLGRRGQLRGQRWTWAGPLLLVGGQALLYKFSTGSWGSTGLAAKWRLSAPHLSLAESARHILFDFAGYIKGLLGGSLGHQTSALLYAYDGNYRRVAFAPFFLLFFLVEICARTAAEWRQRRPGPAALAALWMGFGLLATCTLVEYDAHYHRYQQPFLPLFILFAVLALARLRPLGWGENLARGLAAFFALWGLGSALFFAVAYGENAADIYSMQVQMGRFVDARLPQGARVAINDAGAIRYFGRRPTVDLVGLTSAGFSRAWRHGSGSLYERLESMAPEARPEYFAIFPNWFNFPGGTFLHPLHRIRLLEPSIVDAEKVLYRAAWDELVDADSLHGEQVRQTLGHLRVVAILDVADLASEEAHAYRSQVRRRGEDEANLLMALPVAAGQLLDGGRTVTGGERMRVDLPAAGTTHVVMRTVSGIRQHFEVYCNGRLLNQVQLPGGPGRQWLEVEIAAIPGPLHQGRAEIEMRPVPTGGALRPIVSFHYWFLQ